MLKKCLSLAAVLVVVSGVLGCRASSETKTTVADSTLPKDTPRVARLGWTIFPDATGGPASNTVRAMFIDRDGNYWFGTEAGVSRYDGKTWRNFNESDGLGWGDFTSQAFFPDSRGNIWSASRGAINRFDGKSWHAFTEKDGIDFRFLMDVSSIAEDKHGDIWFGTRYSKPIATFIPGTTPDPNVNKQPEGGIYRFDGRSWQRFTTSDGLVSNAVQAMARDNQGNLWFGTDKGVSRFDGADWKAFTRADGLADGWVHSIYVDRTGNLWFSADGGLSRFDGSSWRLFALPGMNDVYNRIAEGKGFLWAGDGGSPRLFRFDGKSWITITDKDGLPAKYIHALAAGHDGSIWLGTDEGLAHYDGSAWQSFAIPDGREYQDILSLVVDAQGNVWCRTGYGIALYSPGY